MLATFTFAEHLIFNSLSLPLEHIALTVVELQGWTVILKEGLYINGLGYQVPNFFAECPRGQPIEIVGLNEVRLLLTHNFAGLFNLRFINLTVRNIRIYDCRPIPNWDDAVLTAKCQLIDVKIYAPRVVSLKALQDGSIIEMNRCTVKSIGFSAQHGGVIRAKNCLLSALSIAGINYVYEKWHLSRP